MEDSNDKLFGVLAYLGILVLVPIIAGKTAFTKFHANQGLVLAIAEFAIGLLSVIFSFIPVIRVIFGFIFGILGMACTVFAIIGIVYAAQGQMKELPVIGSIKLIK